MSVEQLRALLKDPEDSFIERKPESVNRAEIRQTVVAFANSVPEGREAVLFIGVLDKGEIEGVTDPDGRQKLVREVCERDCYPPIKYHVEVLKEGDKVVVAVVVPPSDRRPHFAGPAYVRRGSESVSASDEMYEELIASRHDKARALLQWKNTVITVLEDGYQLERQRVVPSGWRATRECRIVACDPHIVRLLDISNHINFTVPLSQVVLGYDENKHRKQLTVRP